MTRITQKSIAQRMGISPSLVSRALAGKAGDIGILPETVALIKKTALKMGYVPNAAARQLRGTGGPVLGVIAADLEDPFFGPVLAEITRRSHRAGYALALAGFDHRAMDARELDLLLEQDLAGLVVVGGGPIPWIRPFAQRGVPIVRIGGGTEVPGVHQVASDERQGFDLLVRTLTQRGHRHPGFVGAAVEAHVARHHIFKAALRAAGLRIERQHVVMISNDVMTAGLLGGEKLLKQAAGHPPSVIVCSSDTVAFGLLRQLAMAGMRVPDHVSVTGFDDLALAQLTSPPLTTLHQPIPELIALALKMIGEGKPGTSTTRLPLSLIHRGSVTAAWSAYD
jgi:LacI family transcriptional regulator